MEKQFWDSVVMKLNSLLINLHGINDWVPLENLIEIPEYIDQKKLIGIMVKDGCVCQMTEDRAGKTLSILIR